MAQSTVSAVLCACILTVDVNIATKKIQVISASRPRMLSFVASLVFVVHEKSGSLTEWPTACWCCRCCVNIATTMLSIWSLLPSVARPINVSSSHGGFVSIYLYLSTYLSMYVCMYVDTNVGRHADWERAVGASLHGDHMSWHAHKLTCRLDQMASVWRELSYMYPCDYRNPPGALLTSYW